MMHVVHIVGARPNFMKVAAVHRALVGKAKQTLIHTGQHYDQLMSDIFFQQLELPPPDAADALAVAICHIHFRKADPI